MLSCLYPAKALPVGNFLLNSHLSAKTTAHPAGQIDAVVNFQPSGCQSTKTNVGFNFFDYVLTTLNGLMQFVRAMAAVAGRICFQQRGCGRCDYAPVASAFSPNRAPRGVPVAGWFRSAKSPIAASAPGNAHLVGQLLLRHDVILLVRHRYHTVVRMQVNSAIFHLGLPLVKVSVANSLYRRHKPRRRETG